MKRSGFLAAALALGGLLGAAEVRSASVEQQRALETFRKQAAEQRKAQGLDKDRKKLYAKYPTPEVKLAPVPGGGDLAELPVGTETTLVATGRFVPGSFAHLNCVGVEVVSQKITESRLEVRVRALNTALPGACELRVLSPVSLAYEDVVALRVLGTLQFELETANGLKTRMRVASQRGAQQLLGSSEWFSKDGKPQGTRQVKVDESGGEGFFVHVMRTDQEQQASAQTLSAGVDSGDSKAAQNELKAIQDKMQAECMKLPADKMGPCLQKYTGQMKAASEKLRNATSAVQQKAVAAVVGCQTMKLEVAGGKVSGRGNNCGAPGEVNVKGTVTVSK
jgi:hypothetical protein